MGALSVNSVLLLLCTIHLLVLLPVHALPPVLKGFDVVEYHFLAPNEYGVQGVDT